MKLNLPRKTTTPASSDAKKASTIQIRLKKVSETVRHKQIAAEKSTPAIPRTPLPAGKVKITLKRKTPPPAGNLTLNSGSQVAVQDVPGHPAPVPTDVLWKGRKMHGRHLPVLQCNNCSISRVCPKFKAGYECAYLPFLNSHKVETAEDLIEYMKMMAGNSMKRVQLMSIIETANGGMPSVETSEAMDMAFRQLKELHGVVTENAGEDSVEIEGDATILGAIFGGMKLEKIVDETRNMKQTDPIMLTLPEVPLAQGDIRAPAPADVSEELIRDAIMGPSGGLQPKKNLQAPQIGSIAQGEITKDP